MPRNAQGLYSLPTGNPVVSGTVIESQWANGTMDDIATALTGSLPRNGSAPMIGQLTLSGQPPVSPTHAVDKAYVDKFMSYASGMPLASITAYAGGTAPPGWLKCDGSTVSRTTYADLFAIIGTTFGAGDNSTTFGLPDLRNEFVRGRPDSRAIGNKQAASFASHAHAINDPSHTHNQHSHSHHFNLTTGVEDVTHTHNGVTDTFNGAHSHTGTTLEGGRHQHAYTAPGGTYNLSLDDITLNVGTSPDYTEYAGEHSHPFLTDNSTVQHAHALTTYGESNTHVHNVAGDADDQTPTILASTTGISIGVTGGSETVPQNMVLDYYIKALNDGTGALNVLSGITSNDTNMIAIDITNPVVPELDIKSNTAFGIPKLDSLGKISLSQLPAGVQSFLGTFDASGGQNPSEVSPGTVYVDGNTYLVSAPGTIAVYDPNTNIQAATPVELGWNLVYLANTVQPHGWYFIEAAVVTAAVASQVAFSPSGTIAAIDVQSAIVELDNETQASLALKAVVGSALPGGNGTASAGVSAFASRQDHIHPTDTSRAPASASTATGTSFAPQGNIAATTVQGAIVELDNETQASLALKAAVGSALPSGNGTASAGVSTLASRQDHIHPTDTSRAPASASTATGTSFTPQGNIAAIDVQSAIVELDNEKLSTTGGTVNGNLTVAGTVNAANIELSDSTSPYIDFKTNPADDFNYRISYAPSTTEGLAFTSQSNGGFRLTSSGEVYFEKDVVLERNSVGEGSRGLVFINSNTPSFIYSYHDLSVDHGIVLGTGGTGADFFFHSTGYMTTPAGSAPSSDSRLKDNQQIIGNALYKLNQISGKTYTRNDIFDYSGKALTGIGVIAQEVQAVIPEAVQTCAPMSDKQKEMAEAANIDGFLAVDYNGVVALLVEAVKELSAEVAALRNQISQE